MFHVLLLYPSVHPTLPFQDVDQPWKLNIESDNLLYADMCSLSVNTTRAVIQRLKLPNDT